jgi:DNA polymerase III sliding clamp (beta) subunit (PCNA family)
MITSCFLWEIAAAVIRTADLLTSIQRVLEISDERTSGVKFHLEANTLTISSLAADRGESEEILAVSYSSDPVTIGFNGNYLLGILRTVGAKRAMRLSLKDANSAGLPGSGEHESGIPAAICGHADEGSVGALLILTIWMII